MQDLSNWSLRGAVTRVADTVTNHPSLLRTAPLLLLRVPSSGEIPQSQANWVVGHPSRDLAVGFLCSNSL